MKKPLVAALGILGLGVTAAVLTNPAGGGLLGLAQAGGASLRRWEFLALIRKQLGKRYVLGANGPDAFDCASLPQYCWGLMGITGVPECVTEQMQQAPRSIDLQGGGRSAALNLLKPGDCIGFDFDPGGRYDHVGIWTGRTIIHATGGAACPNHPTSRCKVVEDPPSHFSSSSWRGIYSYIVP